MKLKLTLAFAGVMALVLVATGLFVYLRLGDELDARIDDGLRSRADEVSALIRQSDSELGSRARGRLSEQEESFAQILDARRDAWSTPRPGPRTQPDPHGRRSSPARGRARSSSTTTRVPGVEDGEARLLATPVQARDRS